MKRQQGITAREDWPQILDRLAQYAAAETAPTRASEEIAREFGCGDRGVYNAIQRGEVPHYQTYDRARALAWREGRSRYLRSDSCKNCDGRVFYSSDGRCLACDETWRRKHLSQLREQLRAFRETDGDYYTGHGLFSDDRVLFLANEKQEPFRRGRKLHSMAAAMLDGATIDELSMITGWIPQVVSSTFYLDLRKKGYGVERKSGHYYLMLHESVEQIPLA